MEERRREEGSRKESASYGEAGSEWKPAGLFVLEQAPSLGLDWVRKRKANKRAREQGGHSERWPRARQAPGQCGDPEDPTELPEGDLPGVLEETDRIHLHRKSWIITFPRPPPWPCSEPVGSSGEFPQSLMMDTSFSGTHAHDIFPLQDRDRRRLGAPWLLPENPASLLPQQPPESQSRDLVSLLVPPQSGNPLSSVSNRWKDRWTRRQAGR